MFKKLLTQSAYHIIVAGTLFFIGSSATYAARIYILPLQPTIPEKTTFTAEVFLDTQEEEINALDIDIEYPDEFFKVKELSDASSLINVWVSRPEDKKGEACVYTPSCRVISLSGIAPGGFEGNGRVLLITLESQKIGSAEMSVLPQSRVFLDRPDGTAAFTVTNSMVATITADVEKPIIAEQRESRPESFPVFIEKNSEVFENNWFLSFSAQGKESGIAYYEVQERFLGIFPAKWERAESPYIIHSQNLLSRLVVRAVDTQGNSFSSVVTPTRLKILYSITSFAVSFLIVMWGVRRILRKRLPELPA